MISPEHKKHSRLNTESLCEKKTAQLCRKLLHWHEGVLSRVPGLSGAVLTEHIVCAASLFVLREKGYFTEHNSLPDPAGWCVSSGSYSSLLQLLPDSIRQLEIFSVDRDVLFPDVPEELLRRLAELFCSFLPALVRLDPPAEWLGRIFELLLSGNGSHSSGFPSRKSTGSFYTPRTVVSCMVKEALIHYFCRKTQIRQWPAVGEETFRNWLEGALSGNTLVPELVPYRKDLLELLMQCRLLDPSCGAGFFLLESFRLFLLLWEDLEKTDPSCREEIFSKRGSFLLQHTLYGMDIQSFPLQIAQFCFFLEYSASGIGSLPEGWRLYCCNAIVSSPPGMENFFDIIIGNPPYVAIPSIPPAERTLYRKSCRFARGRFNLFYLFLEKTQDWMKKGACSVLLVPDRVLLNTQCVFLRDFLLEQMILLEWISFENPLFRSTSVDPVILMYCNPSWRDQEKPLIRCKKNISLEALHNRNYSLLTAEELCSSSRTGSEEKIRSLREKILQKSSLLLEDIVTIRDGIIQGSVGKKLFLKGPLQEITAPAEECGKLLFGRDITHYRIHFQENYVHYNIPLMKALEKKHSRKASSGLRMRKKEIFLTPKILSRQTADRIIAALDEKGEYFYANTLHGSEWIPSGPYNLYCILGIMNSSPATFLYRSQSMEQGKTFAQIKIALLKKLPIPSLGKKEQEQIASLVRKILTLPPEEDSRKSFAKLCGQINAVIYQHYDLTGEEILLLEDMAPAF